MAPPRVARTTTANGHRRPAARAPLARPAIRRLLSVWFFDVHPGDEPIPEGIPVDDASLTHRGSVERSYALLDVHCDHTAPALVEPERLHARIDLRPLARPVVAHGIATLQTATLPGVRPVDVVGHLREHGL